LAKVEPTPRNHTLEQLQDLHDKLMTFDHTSLRLPDMAKAMGMSTKELKKLMGIMRRWLSDPMPQFKRGTLPDKEMRARFTVLWKSGMLTKDIAKEMGWNKPEQASSMATRLGLTMRQPRDSWRVDPQVLLDLWNSSPTKEIAVERILAASPNASKQDVTYYKNRLCRKGRTIKPMPNGKAAQNLTRQYREVQDENDNKETK